jgi:hypothetical protein
MSDLTRPDQDTSAGTLPLRPGPCPLARIAAPGVGGGPDWSRTRGARFSKSHRGAYRCSAQSQRVPSRLPRVACPPVSLNGSFIPCGRPKSTTSDPAAGQDRLRRIASRASVWHPFAAGYRIAMGDGMSASQIPRLRCTVMASGRSHPRGRWRPRARAPIPRAVVRSRRRPAVGHPAPPVRVGGDVRTVWGGRSVRGPGGLSALGASATGRRVSAPQPSCTPGSRNILQRDQHDGRRPAVERIFTRWRFWIVYVGAAACSRASRGAGSRRVRERGASGAGGAPRSWRRRLRRRLAPTRARALAAALLYLHRARIRGGLRAAETDVAHAAGIACGALLDPRLGGRRSGPRLGSSQARACWSRSGGPCAGVAGR